MADAIQTMVEPEEKTGLAKRRFLDRIRNPHDGGAGQEHDKAVELLSQLFEAASGAINVQVLSEFYSAATKKLAMRGEEAEAVIRDLASWTIHCPRHEDLLKAVRLHRRHKIAWWDAMIVTSAVELGCAVLWTEDLTDGRRFGPTTIRNPFR